MHTDYPFISGREDEPLQSSFFSRFHRTMETIGDISLYMGNVLGEHYKMPEQWFMNLVYDNIVAGHSAFYPFGDANEPLIDQLASVLLNRRFKEYVVKYNERL